MIANFHLNEEDKLKLSNLKVPLPMKEDHRLNILRQTKLLDSNTQEECFDRYTRLCSRIFQTPVAIVALMDADRNWFKSSVGFPAPQVPRDHALCSHIILESCERNLVIEDASNDERFKNSPLVTQGGLRFYAGSSIICQGMKMGALCVIDMKPRYDFNEKKRKMLSELSDLVSAMIENRRIQALEDQGELAKLIVGVHHHLKDSLQQLLTMSKIVEKSFHEIRRRQSNCEQYQTWMRKVTTTLPSFFNELGKLSTQIDLSIEVATQFHHAHDTLSTVSTPRGEIESPRIQEGSQEKLLTFMNGESVVTALKKWSELSPQVMEQMDWTLGKEFDDSHLLVKADMTKLGVVLGLSMTLGARGCDLAHVLITMEPVDDPIRRIVDLSDDEDVDIEKNMDDEDNGDDDDEELYENDFMTDECYENKSSRTVHRNLKRSITATTTATTSSSSLSKKPRLEEIPAKLQVELLLSREVNNSMKPTSSSSSSSSTNSGKQASLLSSLSSWNRLSTNRLDYSVLNESMVCNCIDVLCDTILLSAGGEYALERELIDNGQWENKTMQFWVPCVYRKV
eukprot:gene4997-5488_t